MFSSASSASRSCVTSRLTRARRRLTPKDLRCPEWNDPRPTTREIAAYYAQLYRLSYKGAWQPKAKHVYRAGRVARDRYDRLAGFLARSHRILDVGA